MRKYFFGICVLVLTLAGANDAISARPGGNGCSNVPVSVSFVTSPTSAINNDIGQVYQNGVDGVEAQVWYLNDCLGSHDATMQLPTTGKKVKRKVSFKFPAPVPGSDTIDESAPAFAGGPAFLTPIWMNIRNVTGFGFIPQNQQTVYYTRMIFQFEAPDGGNYRLVFDPDQAPECPAGPGEYCNTNFGGPDPLDRNLPVQTAWVKVTHTPPPNPAAPWSLTNADTWRVEGNLTSVTNPTDPTVERGALLRDGIHVGQYSMPFEILITANAKLPQQP